MVIDGDSVSPVAVLASVEAQQTYRALVIGSPSSSGTFPHAIPIRGDVLTIEDRDPFTHIRGESSTHLVGQRGPTRLIAVARFGRGQVGRLRAVEDSITVTRSLARTPVSAPRNITTLQYELIAYVYRYFSTHPSSRSLSLSVLGERFSSLSLFDERTRTELVADACRRLSNRCLDVYSSSVILLSRSSIHGFRHCPHVEAQRAFAAAEICAAALRALLGEGAADLVASITRLKTNSILVSRSTTITRSLIGAMSLLKSVMLYSPASMPSSVWANLDLVCTSESWKAAVKRGLSNTKFDTLPSALEAAVVAARKAPRSHALHATAREDEAMDFFTESAGSTTTDCSVFVVDCHVLSMQSLSSSEVRNLGNESATDNSLVADVFAKNIHILQVGSVLFEGEGDGLDFILDEVDLDPVHDSDDDDLAVAAVVGGSSKRRRT